MIQRGHTRILFVNLPLAFPFPLLTLPLPFPLSLFTTRGKDRRDVDHRALAWSGGIEVDDLSGQGGIRSWSVVVQVSRHSPRTEVPRLIVIIGWRWRHWVMVMNDVMVVVVLVVLWGHRSTWWLWRLVSLLLLLLLHEKELVVPLAVHTLSLPVLTFVFSLPFTLLAIRPSFLPLSLASRFLGGWDPFIGRDDSRSRHPAVRRFQHPIRIDVYGGDRPRGRKIVLVGGVG